jgi:hypothetical protein
MIDWSGCIFEHFWRASALATLRRTRAILVSSFSEEVIMAKRLKSGATVPMANRPKILEALNRVADDHDVDPAAIAGMIHTESVWKTDCVTGQYIGLTQVGPELPRKMGLTRKQFLALSAPEQILAYGLWLDHYRFTAKMKTHKIAVLDLPLARQAALLQAMQFAPNAEKWKAALAKGNFKVRSTTSRQAKVLGDTSIGDMEAYYAGFFKKHKPEHE